MKTSFAVTLLTLSLSLPAIAQKNFPAIRPDRSVSFQFRAPNASNVVLTLEASTARQAMTKSADGVWSATVGPLAPNIYAYSFWLDGVRMPDLASPGIKPEPMPISSMFEVPADQPQLYDFDPAIPHGTVRLHDYASKSLNQLRRLRVYTPPGYDRHPRTRYPVLILLHGGFDNEATWTEYGRAHFILDNLIAAKKAVPMIVVMVNGFATRNPPANNSAAPANGSTAFEDDLLNDALPFVEGNYRIKSGRENRAITGLSMGGGQSLAIGLTHLPQFAWVGGMSASLANREAVLAQLLKDPKAANQKLDLLWLTCGKSDGLMRPNQDIDAILTQHGIHHTFVPLDGGHEWTVWRRGLETFLPLIFTDKK